MTAAEEYVPHMMDQGHPHKGEQGSLLSPSWGDKAPEAELFQEPRDGPAGHAGSKDYRVPLIPQEQAYTNHGSQEVQVATASNWPAPAVSYPSGGGRRGCRRGAKIRHHHRGVRSKAFSGGRPSAGEVPQGLPLAEDPWSSGELLATALPYRRRPGFWSC